MNVNAFIKIYVFYIYIPKMLDILQMKHIL